MCRRPLKGFVELNLFFLPWLISLHSWYFFIMWPIRVHLNIIGWFHVGFVFGVIPPPQELFHSSYSLSASIFYPLRFLFCTFIFISVFWNLSTSIEPVETVIAFYCHNFKTLFNLFDKPRGTFVPKYFICHLISFLNILTIRPNDFNLLFLIADRHGLILH